MRGYGTGALDMNASNYGRTGDNEINNRMSEPREEDAVACAKCG